jgi:4-hydroxybenzoyl-CoA reductase subunit beta
MALPTSQLVRPATLAEALVALSGPPEDAARALGGGTDLLVALKQGHGAPRRLVDLTAVDELRQVSLRTDGLTIGAGVRVAELAEAGEVRRALPALAQAADVLASPPLRNSGTVGGNLCLPPRCLYFNQSRFWRDSEGCCLKTGGDICRAAPGSRRCLASFSADLPPALIALQADVYVARWDGAAVCERCLPLEGLYQDDGLTWLRLAPGEIVTGIRVPLGENVRSGYSKYRLRGSIDFPLAGVAVAFRLEEGLMRDARVVVGALGSAPLRAVSSEEVLEGRAPDESLLDEAAALVTRGTRPARNQGDSPGHRREMARVMCRRLLASLTAARSG